MMCVGEDRKCDTEIGESAGRQGEWQEGGIGWWTLTGVEGRGGDFGLRGKFRSSWRKNVRGSGQEP